MYMCGFVRTSIISGATLALDNLLRRQDAREGGVNPPLPRNCERPGVAFCCAPPGPRRHWASELPGKTPEQVPAASQETGPSPRTESFSREKRPCDIYLSFSSRPAFSLMCAEPW